MRFPNKALLLALGLAGALSPAVHAADSLIDVARAALANDAQFQAARAQREASAEKLPQARAGLLPSVTLNGTTQWNDVEVRAPVDRTTQYNSHNFGVQLTQPLFRWGNWVQFEQGRLQVAAADAQLALARQDVLLRAAQAYFDLLYAQDVLTSILAQKIAAAEQLELARRSFEVGTVTITDVHEAQSRFDLAGAQEIAARSDIEVKRHALAVITGRVPDALRGLRPDVIVSLPQPARMEDWVERAQTESLSVLAQQANQEIARREIERQRAGHYPSVDLVATYGQNKTVITFAGAPLNNETTTGTVGVQVSVPLFQGLGQESRVRESAHLLDRASADLDFARRSSAQQARQAWLGVANGIAQTAALRAAQVSSQSSLDANRLGYEVGVRINIDVLNAQQQLYLTRRDLAKARYDTLLAQLRLKAAAGQLAEPEIEAVNGLLE
ncbi:Putative type I secretion outer membrane efflux TolC protein [Methyloversatilis universalis FAM5]|uniref:Type I secretion outer membrane efflux TolC protein n=1 Tax=Methyloversatilis universalis (strain ATCC BAA-1314 / DSM 25237 / JCM 13912 / CCUG 52030 / FAM5) TaxID=1000565 RepID=F5RG72_METUF|nr:TolC family outer membrane protein [Methyloversatilis universalis]EGK70560.1 Putative type I secretion outer membrane efflux TolC protein [Methyloversatilis universalis FAM5]